MDFFLNLQEFNTKDFRVAYVILWPQKKLDF